MRGLQARTWSSVNRDNTKHVPQVSWNRTRHSRGKVPKTQLELSTGNQGRVRVLLWSRLRSTGELLPAFGTCPWAALLSPF